jgi:hypothetical protein
MASVNQTRPHCVNQMGKTHSKPFAARHGRGMAWARHAMCESALTPCYKIPHSWYTHTTRNSLYLLNQRPAKVDELQKTPEWFSHTHTHTYTHTHTHTIICMSTNSNVFMFPFYFLTALCCLHATIHPPTTTYKWRQNWSNADNLRYLQFYIFTTLYWYRYYRTE